MSIPPFISSRIFDRLYDLGYKDEVAYLEDDGKILSNHTLFKTHKELTERGTFNNPR